MIKVLQVDDYQSIAHAQVKLGKFTVITGPSNSGKSALIRALKLLAFNALGTSFVRVGASTCKVAAASTDWEAGIQRGKGKDAYVLRNSAGERKTFTKLDKKVPEAAQYLLALQPVNFAGQLDRPFLLDDSGSAVARTLGELTNVTLVYDAAREANRRKLEKARELKTWETQLFNLREAAKGYAGIKDRLAAAKEAELRMEGIEGTEDMLSSLERLSYSHRMAAASLVQAEKTLADLEMPSADSLDELLASRARLRTLYAQFSQADQAARQWDASAREAELMETDLHERLHEVLVEAGVCPTCGQTVPEG